MGEQLQSVSLRRVRVSELAREIEALTNHYQNKLDLQHRMTVWCTELMDDLLLIDSEVLSLSRYRRPINEMRLKIQNCWQRIELCYDRIIGDFDWLRNRVDVVSQPDLEELWWLMAEDIKQRQIDIQDRFISFFEINVQFREMVSTYSEIFRDDPHFIFGRYRHFE